MKIYKQKNNQAMPRERTQLNINIDPALLLKLKSEAIKQGKTLTNFVVDKLKGSAAIVSEENLEQRLLRVEALMGIDHKLPDESNNIGTIFTEEGANEYGEVAKKEFESIAKKKGITIGLALEEVNKCLQKYPYANPELIFQILLGTHQLTGLEMTNAYRNGSCAMRSALNDWSNDPLEALNEAFLRAVKTRSLA